VFWTWPTRWGGRLADETRYFYIYMLFDTKTTKL